MPDLRRAGFASVYWFSGVFRVQDIVTILHVGCTFVKKFIKLYRDFNSKLPSCKRGGVYVAKQGTWMACLYCVLYWFPSSPFKLTNQISYQLIMHPFLFPVSKWHFAHKEYNKQYLETYSDEIKEWIEYQQSVWQLQTLLDVFKIWASPEERYCGLTRPFASGPDFCCNKWGF